MPQNSQQMQETLTFGTLFSDGVALDRLRGGDLVMCHDGKELTGHQFQHSNGCVYKGAELDPSFEMLLPSRSEHFGNIANLLADAEKNIAELLAVDERTASLLATFAASTWFHDVLPATPVVNICAPPGADARTRNLLACICRRGLVLAQPSIVELLNLPTGFAPTLIVRPTNLKSVAAWLSAVTSSDTPTLRDGTLRSLRYPVAIFSSEPIGGAALSVVLPNGVRWRPLLAHERADLMDRFPPRFLSLRLQQHQQVTASPFDIPQFAQELRISAVALGATLEGAPDLQRRLIATLNCVDQDAKAARSQTTTAIVLDAILAKCHAHFDDIYIAEAAKSANLILLGRRETFSLTPRKVGEILRASTGLSSKHETGGYRIRLDRKAALKIHDAAEFFGVLRPFAGCSCCEELNRTPSGNGPCNDHNDHNHHNEGQSQGDNQ